MAVAIAVSAIKSSPLYFVFYDESNWQAALFVPLALTVLLLLASFRRRHLTLLDRFILGFLALFVIAAMLSVFTSVSPERTLPQAGILLLMTMFLGLTYWQRWHDKRTLSGDLLLIFVLTVASQFAGLISALLGEPWALAIDGRLVGILGNANYVGMVSAVGAVLGLGLALDSKRNGLRVVIALGGLVLLPSLLWSESRGSMLGLAAGVLLALAAARAWRSLLAVALLGIGSAFALIATIEGVFDRNGVPDITSGRSDLWAVLFQHWTESPFVGKGYRTIEVLSGTDGLAAHNIFIWVLTELGVVGILIFLGILVALVMKGRINNLAGAALAVLVIELTESTLYGWGGPAALIFWLVLIGYAGISKSHDSMSQLPNLPARGRATKTVGSAKSDRG